MKEHIFKGKWISSAEHASLEPVNVFHRQLEKTVIDAKGSKNAHILFRKRFSANAGTKTYIYISADDYYKLYINGSFVCQGPAPGYHFNYYYNTVDITDHIIDGENIIAVHTYYQGLINRVWVSGDDRHGLILDIEQSGESILSSDESFVYAYHDGFELMGHEYGYHTQYAERYVSGRSAEGFELPGYDDSTWKNACVREHIDYTLVSQPSEMLVLEDIVPTLTVDENGITADFGSTYVGYLCADAKGKKGERITLLFAQELNEDKSLRYNIRANCEYREEWILSGGDDKLNEFDYKAFRYARFNLPEGCKVGNIRLRARHYPFELRARPNTDDPELLRIWELCVHSLEYGVQEVIQDCMDREKGNYLGDGCYTALAYTVLTHDASMLKKLVDDSIRSRFVNRGLMTCAACSFMQEIAEYPLMLHYMLYSYYRFSGDREYLEKHYDALCDILDFYRESYAEDDGLLNNLDKWCVVEWPSEYRDGYDVDVTEGKVCTTKHNAINAHYIGAVKYMNKIARVLGREDYCDENTLTQAYLNAFFDEQIGLFRDSVETKHISLVANVFPFMYGLFPSAESEKRMLDFVDEKGFSKVMLFGAYPLLAGLKRIGDKEKIYRFLSDEGAWKRMLREGATTTFEGWGKDSKHNASLFHLTLSYAALFLTDWE